MQLFYGIESSPGSAILDEQESTHCTKILRKRVGDEIIVVDGLGTWMKGRITQDKKQVEVSILEKIEAYKQRPFSLEIAIAPTKNTDRMEWFLEKSIEMGIQRIVFIRTERTERAHIPKERFKKLAIAAMKQSGQAYLPLLEEMALTEYVPTFEKGIKLVAWLPTPPPPSVSQMLKPNEHTSLLIGPEGDFTPKEIAWATNQGFNAVSLGPNRLRTETAGVFAAAAFSFVNL